MSTCTVRVCATAGKVRGLGHQYMKGSGREHANLSAPHNSTTQLGM